MFMISLLIKFLIKHIGVTYCTIIYSLQVDDCLINKLLMVAANPD